MLFDRCLIAIFQRLQQVADLLRDKRGSCEIPPEIIREIARCLLSDIVAYCGSQEGKAEYEKWRGGTEGEIIEPSLPDTCRAFRDPV